MNLMNIRDAAMADYRRNFVAGDDSDAEFGIGDGIVAGVAVVCTSFRRVVMRRNWTAAHRWHFEWYADGKKVGEKTLYDNR